MRTMISVTFRVFLISGLVMLAGCAGRGAGTGGKPDPHAQPPSRPGVIQGTLRPPGRVPLSALAEAVIYVDRTDQVARAPAKRRAVRPPRARIGIEARGFKPRVVAVGRGDSVDFVNRDRRYHSAFSVSAPRRFDLGSIPPGGVRSLRFDRPGAVRMFCTLHSDSSGYVFVAPSQAFARPDAYGAFALPELPPGSYRLRAWHPHYGERSWQVELTRRGMALTLGF